MCCSAVIRACSESAKNRRETWINDEIIRAYKELHKLGFAHSVEYWQKDRLVGGLYGLPSGHVLPHIATFFPWTSPAHGR